MCISVMLVSKSAGWLLVWDSEANLMKQKLNATQAYIRMCYEAIEAGEPNAGDIALLKVQASEVMEFCAREAMQILGGIGYMRGSFHAKGYAVAQVIANAFEFGGL